MIVLLNFDGSKRVEGRKVHNSDGSPTSYVVTSDGEIWSEENDCYKKLMVSQQTGYLFTGLRIDGRYKSCNVHRIVAKEFLSNEFNYPCVNHKNSNKKDNRYCNLEWCTHKYNSQHGYLEGYNNPKYHNTEYILTVDEIKQICQMIDSGFKNIDIAKHFGVSKSYIANLKAGSTHRDITQHYKFSKHYMNKYPKYKEFGTKGNEGNHYIEPVPSKYDLRYISVYNEESVNKLCELLSQHTYINTLSASYKMNMSINAIDRIRYGEMFQCISEKYNINNGKKSKVIRINIDEHPEKIKDILDVASIGGRTIDDIMYLTNVSGESIINVLVDNKYKKIREPYTIKLKEGLANNTLPSGIKLKVLKFLSTREFTNQQVADEVGVSLSYVNKVKKEAVDSGVL